MQNLVINNSFNSPQIFFNAKKGELRIMGNSTAENPLDYFNRINRWVEAYSHHPASVTKVKIFMVHLNTVSYKCTLNFLKKLKEISDMGYKVKIAWHYEEDDEDMLETGQSYESIIEIPFQFIEEKDELKIESIEEDAWHHLSRKQDRKEDTTKIVVVILIILMVGAVVNFIYHYLK